MDINKQKSDMGVEAVMEYLEEEGYSNVKDVTKIGGEHKGHDVVAEKNGDIIRIEVKCSKNETGVPDCFSTEFDKELKLIPDYFYIVRLKNHKPVRMKYYLKRFLICILINIG